MSSSEANQWSDSHTYCRGALVHIIDAYPFKHLRFFIRRPNLTTRHQSCLVKRPGRQNGLYDESKIRLLGASGHGRTVHWQYHSAHKTAVLPAEYGSKAGVPSMLKQITDDGMIMTLMNQTYSEYKHSLTFRVPRYVVIAAKAVHRLQICPIVHN